MEQISIILAPYKSIIGNIASTVAIMHMFSGVAVCNSIRKRGTAAGISATPFLVGIVMSVLLLNLGSLMGDWAIIRTHIFGFSLNMIYSAFFYIYSTGHDKNALRFRIGIVGAVATAISAYAQFEDRSAIEYRLGVMLLVLLIGLMTSPLLGLPKMIRNKNTEGLLPFPLLVSGTMVSFMWMLYALCINKGTMFFQNVIVFVLCAVQLSLFAVYPSNSRAADVAAPVNVKSKKTK